MDWVNFTSAFRATTPEVVFPWPPLCCRRTGNFIPVNEEGCRLGHLDYLFTKVCLLLLCLSVCLALSGSSVSFSLPLSVCHLLPNPHLTFPIFHLSALHLPHRPATTLCRSAGCIPQVWSDPDLATPETFLRLSGDQSNKNNTGSTPPITTNIS